MWGFLQGLQVVVVGEVGISKFILSTAVDADQEESGGEEPSLEDVTGGGGGRDVGEKRANLECGDGHSSLVVCVFVCVCVCGEKLRLDRSFLWRGDFRRWVGAPSISAEGGAALKNHRRRRERRLFRCGDEKGGAFLVLCLSQLETKTPGSVVLSQRTCLVVT